MTLATMGILGAMALGGTLCFLSGALWGRKTAYKVIRTWDDQF